MGHSHETDLTGRTRRAFLKEAAVYGGAVATATWFGGAFPRAAAQTALAVDWKKQVGLQLFTVRDVIGADVDGTLAKLAAMGYKEVEPVGYNNLDPKAYRAMLDRHGLTAPSTHAAAMGPTQADLDKVLEGYQIMGIKHSMGIGIGAGRGGGGQGAPAPGAAGRGATAPAAAGGNAPQARGGGAPGGAGRGGAGGGGRAAGPPPTIESVKQRAARENAAGKLGEKFGVKQLIHNHTTEFNLLDDGKTTTFDVLAAETDPALVTMEMDIGWASVAGADIVGLFKKYPGRFELWHVKDAYGMKLMPADLAPGQRQGAAMVVPVGAGEVDYKTIFANAALAGLKHFYVEQDNASAWGDSMAAARTSIQNLTTRILV